MYTTFKTLFLTATASGFIAVSAWAQTPVGVPLASPVEVKNEYLKIAIDPARGGALAGLAFADTDRNWAGEGGLIEEGFGVPNPYIPNRRLNAGWDQIKEEDGRVRYRYAYDCDGGNISGLRVERTLDLIPATASVYVTWRVSNKGQLRQWIAPWVHLAIVAGGEEDAADLFQVPTTEGTMQPEHSVYHTVARNWLAATDPAKKESLCSLFDANHLHSVLCFGMPGRGPRGFQAAFVPRMLEPGETWETSYQLHAFRGLDRVDFAGGGIALQLNPADKVLQTIVASSRAIDGLQFYTHIFAPNSKEWKYEGKPFSLTPKQPAPNAYSFTAPAPGIYDFLAEVRRGGNPFALGADLASPHGGVDTQFAAGGARHTSMPAWTSAPDALARGQRIVSRRPAVANSDLLWFENGLEKVFREDQVELQGDPESSVSVVLARNEHESFQLALRPKQNIEQVQVSWGDWENSSGGDRIPATDVACYIEQYHAVRVPSHFEGPTGTCPDALVPYAPFAARADVATPLWFTVFARPGLKPGDYLGRVEVQASGLDPLEFQVKVKVFDFELPARPALRTDFRFWPKAALAAQSFAPKKSGAPTTNESELSRAYFENAFAHRVTLREASEMPGVMQEKQQDNGVLEKASAFCVPTSELRAAAEDRQFLIARKLLPLGFVPLAENPEESKWTSVLDAAAQWKAAAPGLPLLVSAGGLRPFLAKPVDIWSVHLPVFDTPTGEDVAAAIRENREVWVYLDHLPARPYANFFLDFSGVEHRVLFWQLWALGVRGLQYWSVNAYASGQNPYESAVDATPVNGDGLLLYPGAGGPVNSIRWEIIRDGIEDYDYLAILRDYRRKAAARPEAMPLLKRIDNVFDLKPVLSSLTDFSRDPSVLLAKRIQIGAMIEEASRQLK